MVPPSELERLEQAVQAAEQAADQDLPSSGLVVLLQAQRTAIAAQEAGAPWATELLARYRGALDAYEERHLRAPPAPAESAIPPSDLRILSGVRSNADALATRGERTGGWRLLVGGRERVRMLLADEPWHGALLARWEALCEAYQQRWGPVE